MQAIALLTCPTSIRPLSAAQDWAGGILGGDVIDKLLKIQDPPPPQKRTHLRYKGKENKIIKQIMNNNRFFLHSVTVEGTMLKGQ